MSSMVSEWHSTFLEELEGMSETDFELVRSEVLNSYKNTFP